MISLGIDTGGTYTDAVALDLATGEVLAKGKSPTTKEDLSLGILGALDCLPQELIAKTSMITLSTTLATNACVENKGGRAKLLLLGGSDDILKRVNAEKTYGIKMKDVLCVDTHRTYDGSEVEMPNWEQLCADNITWFADVEALAVAELYSYHTGAVCEKGARDYFSEKLSVPIVLASDIVSDLNVIERGATALLNARLLVVIEEFVGAVFRAVEKGKIPPRIMIMRSDCSLMTVMMAQKVPVETILSGPAASAVGGMHLSGDKNSIIVDMGGTTTDLSIVKNGEAKLTDKGIRIGGWSTQIKGVHVDTFALGGDSCLRIEAGKLTVGYQRVLPVSFAAQRWPQVIEQLDRLLKSKFEYWHHQHEILCLIKEPPSMEGYYTVEHIIIDSLKDGPKMISHLMQDHELYETTFRTDRLEAEGYIIRCGLTPTDLMHVKGDFEAYDKEAALMLSRFFMQNLDYGEEDSQEFADAVYDAVSKKLYCGIVKALLADAYPLMAKSGIDEQVERLVEDSWKNQEQQSEIIQTFATSQVLVGVGAPTHLFLPSVAQALGTKYVTPKHAEVANAIGAALAEVRVEVQVSITPIIEFGVVLGYMVYTADDRYRFAELPDAKSFALKAAEEEVEDKARARGAEGKLTVESGIASSHVISKDGSVASYDLHAWARISAASPAPAEDALAS